VHRGVAGSSTGVEQISGADAQLDPVLGYGVHHRPVRTSEVAARAGVNPQTLRYYERRGLLLEPQRTASGYRVYPARVVPVVRFIKRVQRLGFALDEVATLLDLAEGGPDDGEAARKQATDAMAEVEARIAGLEAIRAALSRLVETGEWPPDRRQILPDRGTAESDR
jgi:DNA-binding transcriptional MerR regulator